MIQQQQEQQPRKNRIADCLLTREGGAWTMGEVLLIVRVLCPFALNVVFLFLDAARVCVGSLARRVCAWKVFAEKRKHANRGTEDRAAFRFC